LSSGYTGLTQSSGVSLYTSSRSGYQYIVQFDTVLGDLPSLTVSTAKLHDSSNAPAFARVTSCDRFYRQLVTTSGDTPLSGSFTLSTFGQETIYLSYDASASQVKIALEDLNDVYAVNVRRSGPSPNNGYEWTIQFVSNE
jgi:hypothetical protein